jgi:hypothetical protein
MHCLRAGKPGMGLVPSLASSQAKIYIRYNTNLTMTRAPMRAKVRTCTSGRGVVSRQSVLGSSDADHIIIKAKLNALKESRNAKLK